MKRIAALLCALLLLLSLGACGKAGKPEETVDAFFRAMQKLDFDKMNACTTDNAKIEWDLTDSDAFSDEAVQKLYGVFQSLASKIEYTVGAADETDTTATVPVAVTYPDASAVVRDAMTDVMADMVMSLFGEEADTDVYTQLINTLAEKMEAATVPMQNADLQLPLTKTDDGWRISELSDALMNVLSANMSDAFAEASTALTGQ